MSGNFSSPNSHVENPYRLAAEQGDAGAMRNLGVMYDVGQGVAQDFKEAVKWYRLAAEQGYAGAQSDLGGMYANGQGVAQDFKEAVKWFRLAAEQGNTIARFNLGLCFTKGEGVEQDLKEAVKWFRLAAEQGDTDAQFSLGAMYAKGHGVNSNPVVAYALLNLSQTNAPANKNYAAVYRADLAASMAARDIDAGQDLTREIAKPGNFLTAIDKFINK